MPELPEVETVKRGLQTYIVGKTIASISYDWPKGFPNEDIDLEQSVIGASVTMVRRRAKLLIIELSSGYSMVCHLKMTGQFVYRGQENFGAGHPNDSLVGELPDTSTRVTVTFKDGTKLFFNDQRKFGWIKIMPSEAVPDHTFYKTLGPEPLADDFLPAHFIKRLRTRSTAPIKAALLDQTVIAGVGNIYTDESLWGAGIHPAQVVSTLTDQQLTILYKELRYVLRLSIQKGGSTDKNYVNADGKKGSYLAFAKVFRREGLPCPKCHATIQKIRVAGRGTHLCPTCQKIT